MLPAPLLPPKNCAPTVDRPRPLPWKAYATASKLPSATLPPSSMPVAENDLVAHGVLDEQLVLWLTRPPHTLPGMPPFQS